MLTKISDQIAFFGGGSSLAPHRSRSPKVRGAAARVGHGASVVGTVAALSMTVSGVWAQTQPWVQRSPVGSPGARYSAAATYDQVRGVTVLFGGQTDVVGSAGLLGDTWTWDGSLWSKRSDTGPSPRTDVALAFDSLRGRLVMFGGDDGGVNGTAFADTWEWDGQVWILRDVVGPEARGAHRMAYDAKRHVTVLFGGVGASRFGDTWEWDGTVWIRRSTTGPSPRAGHAMAYDESRQVVVLFGGRNENGDLSGETWEWNGTVWSLRSNSGPAPRLGHTMVYDDARRVCVLFGGYLSGHPFTPTYSNETWEWNGVAWMQRSITSPSRRFVPAMAFDSVRKVPVLFGGHAETGPSTFAVIAETWELPPCFLITSQPGSSQPCLLQDLTLAIVSSALEPVSYQWRHNGLPLDIVANPSAATRVLTVPSIRAGDAGTYECVVSNACGVMFSDPATVSVCAADFNCDRSVDDADFIQFAASYDVLLCSAPAMVPGCPADINGDDWVDDADFALFAAAYDQMLCP